MAQLCVPLVRPDLSLLKQIEKKANLIEFRLDLWSTCDLETVKKLKEASALPVIFKIDERHLSTLSLEPAYVDIPYHFSDEIFTQIKKDFPHISRICSWHDFKEPLTRNEWEKIYTKPAEIYKIAVQAKSSLDALRLLIFAKQAKKPTLALGMGPKGVLSRILSAHVGSPFTYAPLHLEEGTAPGQLSVQDLIAIYHYDRLNEKTALFGIIGEPLEHSPGHLFHNQAFQEMGYNAIYVKIPLVEEEMEEFFSLVNELDFQGFSVTMPLKSTSSLTVFESKQSWQKSFNTLYRRQGKWKVANTDGTAACHLMEKVFPLKGRHLVFLGAGGTASGIAFEAVKRGAKITILNRDVLRAQKLAADLGGVWASIDDFSRVAKQGYDVLVHCTSVGLEGEGLCIDPENLLEKRLVLDVIHSQEETPIIREAKKKKSPVITGRQLYYQQALEQLCLWLGVDSDAT